MLPTLYVADRAIVDQATTMISEHGKSAGLEAATRADKSRNLGNVVMFCRWRQIERLITVLNADRAVATIH